MKTASKYLIASAFALLTLAGCGNDNEPEIAGRKNAPDFTATIDGVYGRAFNQSWEAGDQVGISGSGRTNVCYITTDGQPDFTAETSGDEIYFQDEKEVTFTAYYPYANLAENATAITADTKSQTAQKTFDFLWTQAKGSKNNPDVNLNFAHKMVKVVLYLKPGNGMTYDEVKNAHLSMKGFHHAGTFNVADGTTAVGADNTDADWVFTDAADKAPVTYNDNEKIVSYSLIFFPQLLAAPVDFNVQLDLTGDSTYNLTAKIDFTAANREKDNDAAKNEWVAGRQYDLSLTLNKTDVKLDNCVITPWSVVKGEEIVVD